MPTLMIYGIALFTLALVFYSTSVWAGWFSKRLKVWHIYVFLIGLIADYVATILTYISLGVITTTLHSILGFVSIILMTIHVVWAVLIMVRNNEKAMNSFHRVSVVVWSIWMLSYLSGFASGIAKIA